MSSDLPPNDSPHPKDSRISRTIYMDSPGYANTLTDPMAEVDEHMAALKGIADRYGLGYFLLVNHPMRDGTVKHQFRCEAVPPVTAAQFYDGLTIELAAISGGTKRIVDVIDEVERQMEDDDETPSWEDPT